MLTENKIISGLWIARDSNLLSNMERLCIHSFCANGHDFHLYVYDDIANVPTDTVGGKVKVCDANEILSASKIFTYPGIGGASLAGFADWFRWELMRKKGSWYVDMDVVCLRPFDFSQDVLFVWDDHYKANSAIMKFPATHPLVTAMADACASPNQIQPWDDCWRIKEKNRRRWKFWKNPHKTMIWGEAGGPIGFTLALKYFQEPYPSHSIVLEALEYHRLHRMIDHTLWELELLEPILKNSYSIHWFHEAWRQKGWDKNGTYPEHSPYETLKRRYLPEHQQ